MPTTQADDRWTRSAASKLLGIDLTTGDVPLYAKEMAPKVVYKRRPEFAQFDFDFFRDRLNEMRKQVRGKIEDDGWKDSVAWKLLKHDLKTGRVPLKREDMGPKDVFMSRPEFAEFDYERFRDRLNNMRNNIIKNKNLAEEDMAALSHDRNIYPKAATNHRGEPRWEGSEAARLLIADVDAGLHLTMKPKALWSYRQEYHKNYPLDVFRGHIHQEVKRRKFLAYWKSKKANH